MMWTSAGARVGTAVEEGVEVDSAFGLSSEDFEDNPFRCDPSCHTYDKCAPNSKKKIWMKRLHSS